MNKQLVTKYRLFEVFEKKDPMVSFLSYGKTLKPTKYVFDTSKNAESWLAEDATKADLNSGGEYILLKTFIWEEGLLNNKLTNVRQDS